VTKRSTPIAILARALGEVVGRARAEAFAAAGRGLAGGVDGLGHSEDGVEARVDVEDHRPRQGGESRGTGLAGERGGLAPQRDHRFGPGQQF
jgi:hypothetical protein